MKHIKVLGITGGVGAGKSTILQYLQERYHAEVLQLDAVAHLLMEPQRECHAQIIAAFGRDILAQNGGIDRQKLYQKAFTNETQVKRLNGIVHPQVKKYVKNWIMEKRMQKRASFLVLEAALLLEDHYELICDEIWYIFVRDDVRAQRLAASRGYTAEKTAQILKNQKSEEQFRAACQFVVDNSGDLLEKTYEQIDKGLKEHEFV